MAEGKYYHSEQVVILVATETMDKQSMALDSIILTATAAGTFAIVIGTVPLSYTVISPVLTLQLYFHRSTNHLELVSGPVGAKMTALLEQKK